MHEQSTDPQAGRRLARAMLLAMLLPLGLRAGSGGPAPRSLADPPGWPAAFAWTWDRHQDLSFLPADVGVAVVEATVELRGATTHVRWRQHRLTTHSATTRLPVVHVDALPVWQAALDADQQRHLAETVVAVARRTAGVAVQIDFEAAPSQRAFYRRVLEQVRRALPGTHLSITALASWCLGDRWLQGLPVDEIVAMAFRMGPRADEYRQRIGLVRRWPAPECSSTGLAIDEPRLQAPAHRRLYLYSPASWTADAWSAAASTHRSPSSP